jgi:Rap1a immunity proteins
MRCALPATILLLSLIAAPVAFALTGSDLAQMCRNPGTDLACDAYVSGFVAGLSTGSVLSRSGKRICLPDTIAPGDVRPVIEKFFAAHPDTGTMGAASAVAVALFATFPCKPGQKPKLGTLPIGEHSLHS